MWWQKTVDLQDNTVISAALAQKIADRQVLRYAGYCYDSESGMYYLSARHYDPATRLFLSKDPSRNDGEQSAYQYCLGNPVGNVDPTGYRPLWETGSRETDLQQQRKWNEQKKEEARKRATKAKQAELENRNAARNYATDGWNDYNPVYSDYLNKYPEKDCAYFASQCLAAGGLTFNPDWWYVTVDHPLKDGLLANWSDAFANSDALYNYLVDSGLGVPTTAYPAPSAPSSIAAEGIQHGDIVFYDWDSDGTMDHTAVVTASSADITKRTQHNPNRTGSPWQTTRRNNEHFENTVCHPVHIIY